MKFKVLHIDLCYFGNLGFDAYIRGRNIFFLISRPFGPTTNPLKSDKAIKKSKSDFVAEYPIWVSIKRALTGRLVVDGQNLIYCIH